MGSIARPSQRNHQFDLLRIGFAVMVLLSHAPELTDGNRSREILARLTTPDFTFGILGVDGFFLLSGYLIVKSWISHPDIWDFMKNRFLRIAPGYAVTVLITTIAIGLLAPAVTHFFHFHHFRLDIAKSPFFIFQPISPPVFPGNHDPALNGSLWTILYEFRCYLIVAISGLIGIFKWPKLWLAASIVLVPFFIAGELVRHIPWINWKWYNWQYGYFGNPVQSIRLTTVFFVGGCFFLFKDNIRFTRPLAWCNVCAILAVRLFGPEYIEAAFVVFGGYLLFFFGDRPMASLSWMAKVPDLSYGVYLYGWPVESYLIWRFHRSPWIVFAESTVICVCLAWLSWTFIEGPALSLKGKTTPSPRRQELKVALATG